MVDTGPRRVAAFTIAAALWACAAVAPGRTRPAAASVRPAPPARPLADVLEPIRAKHRLPALAAAVILDGRTAALAAVGVRKVGTDVKVTPGDAFHVGSCTKAMTATLVATLVGEGKLRWDTTLAAALPDLAAKMHPAYRKVTIRHVLAHRAGLIANWPPGKTFLDMHNLPGPPRRQRAAFAAMVLAQPPRAEPGAKYLYSNAGYGLAGAIAERLADKPWEQLMRERIFQPLGMKTAGFGAMGTPGKIDQPWQHRVRRGVRIPVPPGRLSDNPPVIGPGGTVHCSVGDWAKFVAAHLAGARGRKTPLNLPGEAFRTLHTPPFGGDYAPGWLVTERSWGGGRVLTHAGSNTMNFAVVWMAPKRNFAVLVATNEGGPTVPKACDEAAAALIRRFLPAPATAPARPGAAK